MSFKIVESNLINIIDASTREVILSFPQAKAKQIADTIVSEIKGKSGISKDLIKTIQELSISQVADKSLGKGDINIHIYDPIHAISTDQEFSIKSFLGSDPTLFNANTTTNITYKITDKNNHPISDDDLHEVNSIVSGKKYIKRISKLTNLGYKVSFDYYDDDTFKLNLQVIDSDLPAIIAHIVKDKYVNSIVRINEVIDKLINKSIN